MDYLSEIRQIIADILNSPVSSIDPDAEMTDIEGWDSMRNIQILSTIEDHFGLMIPNDDIFDLTSVRAYAEEIKRLVENNVQS